jgi:hypothetical protein
VKRAALPLAGIGIVAMVLVGAYAMEAYVPVGTPRVVATWGTERAGRPVDAIEVLGIRSTVLRRIRANTPGNAEWAPALRVIVDRPSANEPIPHVIGQYSALGDRIRFEPRFPFAPGVEYRVEVDTRRLAAMAGLDESEAETGELTHRFAVPSPPSPRTTRVVAIHPAADRVPSNMLRWYVEFSAPMEPGSADEHVQLLDETGRPVEDAFLRVDEELWDSERRRLTLLFDPGRVKRGVRANIEMGRPIVEGHRYRLVIDPAWRDANGAALRSGSDKEFEVGPFDADSPNPLRWDVVEPRAGTREPLRVSFREPLDHPLAARMVRVESGRRELDGVGRLELGDSVWTFTPVLAWKAGRYALRVDAALEDLAGNSVARVFDADRRHGAPAAEDATRAGAWRRVQFRVEP